MSEVPGAPAPLPPTHCAGPENNVRVSDTEPAAVSEVGLGIATPTMHLAVDLHEWKVHIDSGECLFGESPGMSVVGAML